MSSMLPLLIVALIVWAGVFAFIFGVDRKVSALERRLEELRRDRKDSAQ
jgi:CcmD family protein